MGKARVVNKVVQEVQMEQTAVVLTSEQLAVVQQFFDLRTLVNEMTKDQKALEAQVREIIGDAEVGVFDGKVRILRDVRHRNNLDKKLLETAFPEAFAACQVSKPYEVFVAK